MADDNPFLALDQASAASEENPFLKLDRIAAAKKPNDIAGGSFIFPLGTPLSEMAHHVSNLIGGGIVGAPSQAVGMPGNIESLARMGINAVGGNVSSKTVWPTGEEIGNAVAGPPEDEYAAMGRFGGGFLTPGAAVKGIRGAVSLIPKALTPTEQATKFVTGIMAKSGKTVNDLAPVGKPLTAAEAIGNQGKGQLMALGRREGTTADTLGSQMYQRFEGRRGRAMDDMAEAAGIHPSMARGDINDVITEGQAAAKPLYKRAFAGGSTAPLETQFTNAFSAASKKANDAQQAIKDAENELTMAKAQQIETQTAQVTGRLRDTKTAQVALKRAQDAQDKLDEAHSSFADAEADKGSAIDMLRTAQSDAATGKKGGIWSPYLQMALADPLVKQGMLRGLTTERLEALANNKKFDPTEFAITGTDEAGDPIVNKVPNMKLLDATKKGLDQIINGTKDATGRINWDDPNIKHIDQIRRNIVGELRQANPDYAEALETSGDYLSSKSAFDRAQNNLLDDKTTAAQFGQMFDKLSPKEVEAAKGGIANKLFDRTQSGKFAPKQFLTPIVKAKINIMFGGEKADKLIKGLETENQMQAFERQASPMAGSPTQPLREAMRVQDEFNTNSRQRAVEDAFINSGGNVRRGLSNAALQWAGSKGAGLLDALRTRGLSEAGRNQAGNLLMMSPDKLADVLKSVPPQTPGLFDQLSQGAGTATTTAARINMLLKLLQDQQGSQGQ